MFEKYVNLLEMNVHPALDNGTMDSEYAKYFLDVIPMNIISVILLALWIWFTVECILDEYDTEDRMWVALGCVGLGGMVVALLWLVIPLVLWGIFSLISFVWEILGLMVICTLIALGVQRHKERRHDVKEEAAKKKGREEYIASLHRDHPTPEEKELIKYKNSLLNN